MHSQPALSQSTGCEIILIFPEEQIGNRTGERSTKDPLCDTFQENMQDNFSSWPSFLIRWPGDLLWENEHSLVYCDPNSVMRQVWVTVQTFLLADCYFVKRPDTLCPTLLLTQLLQSKGSTGLNSEKAWPTDIRSTNFAGKMTAKLETVCRMLTPGRGQIYWAKKICQKKHWVGLKMVVRTEAGRSDCAFPKQWRAGELLLLWSGQQGVPSVPLTHTYL